MFGRMNKEHWKSSACIYVKRVDNLHGRLRVGMYKAQLVLHLCVQHTPTFTIVDSFLSFVFLCWGAALVRRYQALVATAHMFATTTWDAGTGTCKRAMKLSG